MKLQVKLSLKNKKDKVLIRFPSEMNIKKELLRAALILKKRFPDRKVNNNNICIWAVQKFLDEVVNQKEKILVSSGILKKSND